MSEKRQLIEQILELELDMFQMSIRSTRLAASRIQMGFVYTAGLISRSGQRRPCGATTTTFLRRTAGT